MRNSQFLTLVTMLRNELRRSGDASVSESDLDSLRRVINRNYEILYADYDWPVLRRVYPSVPMQAGLYLYDFPDDLDPERVEAVVCWFNGQPEPVERGIGFDEYAIHDTEDDDRSSPVQKWDLRSVDPASVQYEVWPIPDGSPTYVQMRGYRKFARLVNDIDRCLLDDNLVVAFAAAELLASQGSEDADSKLQAARTLYNRIRARMKGAGARYTLLGDQAKTKPSEVVVRVN